MSPLITICAAWLCIYEAPSAAYASVEQCLQQGAIISGQLSVDLPRMPKKVTITCGNRTEEFDV